MLAHTYRERSKDRRNKNVSLAHVSPLKCRHSFEFVARMAEAHDVVFHATFVKPGGRSRQLKRLQKNYGAYVR